MFLHLLLTIAGGLKLNSEGLRVSISFSGKKVSRALATIMLEKLSFYGKIYSVQTGLVCKRTNTETVAGMVPALLNYNYEWTCVMEGKRSPPPLTPGIPSRGAHQAKRELRMGSFFWRQPKKWRERASWESPQWCRCWRPRSLVCLELPAGGGGGHSPVRDSPCPQEMCTFV